MMNQQERDILAKKINFYLKLYGKTDFTINSISQYIDVLESFYNKNLNDYLFALDQYSKNKLNKFFPNPIQLRPYLEQELDEATISNELARTIKNLVNKKGYNWSSGRYYDTDLYIYEGKNENFWTFREAVISEIGPLGWDVIKNFGGWSTICNEANENQNFIPQLREFIKSTIEFKKNNKNLETLQITNFQQNELDYQQKQLGNYLKMKTINE